MLKQPVRTAEKQSMSEERAAVCFTCGQPSGDILRLNFLPSGQVCPSCRDRLLEGVPAPLPSEEVASESLPEPTEVDSELSLGEPAGPVQLSAAKGPGRLLPGDGPDEPA